MRHVLLSLVCLTIASTVAAQDETEHLDGYAEWRQGTEIIVDGQRVRSTAATKFKGFGGCEGLRRYPPRIRSQGDGHAKTRRRGGGQDG